MCYFFLPISVGSIYHVKMVIKLLDLVEQNNVLKQELLKKFEEILDSGQFILGEEVEKFENKMSEFLSCKYCLGVSSGTDALLLALMALDIKPGDEVLCPTYTFFSTASCVSRLGAVPIFVDVNYEDFCISVQDLKKKISNKTKGIIGVHLFGQACECEKILDICSNSGLFFVEDCAQALGAKRNNKFVGTFGDIGCFSFFPSKNLGGFGDSGLVTTNSDSLYEKMKILRTHGMHPKYFHEKIGGNFRIDSLQAALLNIKLNYLNEYISKRREHALYYSKSMQDLDKKYIDLPKESQNNFHTWNQFTIKVLNERRDELKKFLQDSEIGCEVYYPLSLHKQECFQPQFSSMKLAEKLTTQALSIPIYPELKQKQLDLISNKVHSFFCFN